MEKPISLLDRFNQWARNSITLKLIAIGFLILVLLIPSSQVNSLIYERESLRDEANREVSSKWGSDQTLGGPVISIPYYYTYKTDDGKTETSIEYAHFLPDSLFINGELKPEKRYRGIYVVVLYSSKIQVNGNFAFLIFDALPIDKSSLILKDAFVSFGISDMKGIRENITMNINDKNYDFNPGISSGEIFSSGVSFPIDLTETNSLNFSFNLDLNGSSSISYLPFGKETVVNIKSSWGDPSFSGQFLPDERKIDANGFSAKWRVLQLNRNYPQQGTGDFIASSDDDRGSFGVKLLLPVDEYQKTMRSAKYVTMFIILTFLTFFFVEVMNRRRIHSIQYLLVGFAIILFYVLLLSMSEHISFNLSYLVASVIILLLVTLYAKAIFKSNFLTILTFSILSILYAFFYSLLQLQDYALLMGSFGLLFILAVIMYLTRKIDWYAFNTDEDLEHKN